MKKIALIVAGIITLLAIPITVYVIKNQQDIRSRAAPATTLSFTPSTLTKAIDETFNVDVTIDTASNQVYVTELHIGYDPTKLEAVSITNGTLFPNIIISGKIDPSGDVSMTVGAENQSNLITGTGKVATVRFKAIGLSTTPTTIEFISPDTFIGAKAEDDVNVLVGSIPAKVTITSAGNQLASAGAATPTPTTRLSTPTPTGISTLTPTPTGIPLTATTSAIIITAPSQTTSLTTQTPLIAGTAPINATMTIVIHPSGQTISLRSNSLGEWSYTPTSPLETGPHEITITALDPVTNITVTATGSFNIASTTGEGTTDGTPVSGNSTPTVLFIFAGIVLLALGLSIPLTSFRRS